TGETPIRFPITILFLNILEPVEVAVLSYLTNVLDGDTEIGLCLNPFEPLQDLPARQALPIGCHHFELACEDGVAAAEIARPSGEQLNEKGMKLDDLAGGGG